ncbi:Protein PTCD3-like protein, mitochondrial [Aphelenchoides besseyi]|nr:Protein PTCD3-like protein, mitochondrial [Aphelenchoides besseyi]KAI6209225.1 Protein PTCD3-like protein, mitochondrial [Aphelenchoides besseyi]
MAARSLPFSLPKRITRSKTDLLKALSATVGTDKTAPHFAFIDDPATIPTTPQAKRLYFLSKEFGRRAARQLAEEWPTLFMFDRDKPRLEAFRPEKLPNLLETEPVDETTLKRFLDVLRVEDALKVYERLRTNNVELSAETLQRLFELAAYYNCENAPPSENSEWPGLRLFYEDPKKSVEKHAEMVGLLFNQVPKTQENYSTMICWLAKFGGKNAKTKAITLLETMASQQQVPESSALTLLIHSMHSMSDVHQVFQKMVELQIRPTIQHFNAAIKATSMNKKFEAKWTESKKYLAEIAHCGLRPSLTTYELILFILKSEDDNPNSKQLSMAINALSEALDELESRPTIEPVEATDQLFFATAMNVAVLGNNRALVDRIEKLYQSPRNHVKMIVFNNESSFYVEFLLYKIDFLDIAETERLYKELVPRVVGVNMSLINAMLKKLEAGGRPWSLFRRVIEDAINARQLLHDKMCTALLNEVKNYDVTKLNESEREDCEQLLSRIETGIEDIREMREHQNSMKKLFITHG